MDLLVERLLSWGHRFLLSGSSPFPRIGSARTLASQDWRVNSGEEPSFDAVSACVLHCLDITHRRAERWARTGLGLTMGISRSILRVWCGSCGSFARGLRWRGSE